MRPFIVYALPRSRTKWLSRLLTYGDWVCHHDLAIGMRDFDDVVRFFQRAYVGSAETGAAPGWRLLSYYFPNMAAVVVRRPLDEVVPAIINAARGFATYDEAELRRIMRYQARCLDQIAVQPGVLTVEFADLAHEDACGRVFEHCLGEAMPHAHWADLAPRNIQVSYVSILRYFHAHRDRIERFKRDCRRELWSLARRGAI